MKKVLMFFGSVFFVLYLSSMASAVPIFQDDFNSEHGGTAILNYSGFTNWTVTDGTVDLIGNGSWDFLPGNGLYIDMDGSTGNAGKMTTYIPLVDPGAYYLKFDLAGNHINDSPETTLVQVNLGSVFDASYSLGKNVPFTTYTEYFMIDFPTPLILSFEGLGGDNMGMLLDNVEIGTRNQPAPTPEPATIFLLGSGLLGAARVTRKKIKK